MAHEELKERVWRANLGLVEAGLVVLTWGNASGADRKAGVFAIKPSGVPYAELKPEHMVVLSIETGQVVDGRHRPSSDTPTHLELYRGFPSIGGVAHAHSLHATSFAQAKRALSCYGTTHADNFHGTVPVTRHLTSDEVALAYERNTGAVIVECFREQGLDPVRMPAVLVAGHGPFTWGETPEKALENSIVLEFAAHMALNTLAIEHAQPLPKYLLDKHFLRKHGPGAYYGQESVGRESGKAT
jgi:L-ribulose-5-phosphate 4-epimerase